MCVHFVNVPGTSGTFSNTVVFELIGDEDGRVVPMLYCIRTVSLPISGSILAQGFGKICILLAGRPASL
jgi:hypothetical protein